MKELLVATTNPGKFDEIVESLDGLNFKFYSLRDMGFDGSQIVEDGETFADNAYIKAKHFYDKEGILTLGEDSGILVDALEGELGVKTRRWGAGENATDEEWIAHFMDTLKDVPIDARGAKFICSSCLLGEGIEEYFEGQTPGMITEELMAPLVAGIPISSCFVAEGSDKVYAAMDLNEKRAVSHRGRAMGKLRDYLSNNF